MEKDNRVKSGLGLDGMNTTIEQMFRKCYDRPQQCGERSGLTLFDMQSALLFFFKPNLHVGEKWLKSSSIKKEIDTTYNNNENNNVQQG